MPGEGVLCAFSGFAPARQLARPNSDRFISRRPPVEPGVQSKLNGCIIGGAPIRGHSIGEDGPGDFMPVPQGPVFRHGTRAQPFERLAPGTSVATAIGLARNIATGGSCYADTPQPGTPRVMRL